MQSKTVGNFIFSIVAAYYVAAHPATPRLINTYSDIHYPLSTTNYYQLKTSLDNSNNLNLRTQLAYGVGELAGAVPSNILTFFLLFFLTNIVGLNPSLAGSVGLVGKAWDAINDPIIGWLSDHTRSRWGRRFPWMVFGVIPLGLFFFLLWVKVPSDNQTILFLYYSTMVLLMYTAFTSVILPFSTLAAELTEGYDQSTKLISFKSAFSIGGSIFSLVVAQIIFSQVENPTHRYLLLGGVCSGIIIFVVYLCVWGTFPRYMAMEKKRSQIERPASLPMLEQIKIALSNKPFLYLIGIYLFSWLSVQVTASVLQFFVINWMELSENHFTQMALTVQGTALTMMFLWSFLAQRVGKRIVYCLGVPLTIIGSMGLFLVQPGQVKLMYCLACLAGMGISTVYLVPWSMLPDILDLDELNTGQRREGIFYGFVVQIEKIGVAFSVFLVGQTLDWSGFIPLKDGLSVVQPDSALWSIRIITGLIPSLLLCFGLVLVFFYPITRDRHQEIILKLQERRSLNEQ